jgi:hypothetical protein
LGRLTVSQYLGELLGRHGLYDKGVESSLGGPLTIFGSAITRQRDEADAGAKTLSNLTRNLVSIKSWQTDVSQNDVRARGPCGFYTAEAIVSHFDLMPIEF